MQIRQPIRVTSPNTMRFEYHRLRNTQSMQQYSIQITTPQKVKKPHIKMPQQGQVVKSYDPALMVGLIKENQEIKAKIAEKEKQLQLLNEEIALYINEK